MKKKKILKFFAFVILFIGVTVYVVYAMLDMSDGNPREVCDEVSLVVEENPNASFIDEKRVEQLLHEAGLYPAGQLMSEIDTRKIEETLRGNMFISSVECFKTNNGMDVGRGKVCIRVAQRTPVVYVLPDGGNGYYVDKEGVVIPNTIYVKNLVTATGKIDKAFATEVLAPFGVFLYDNSYWDEQIEQIYVTYGQDNKQRVVTLIPRRGDHEIFMGTMDKFETKLRRLRTFYDKGLPEVGWNRYSRLDLEYDNQIVCTKRKL